jgi:hypothetical protein
MVLAPVSVVEHWAKECKKWVGDAVPVLQFQGASVKKRREGPPSAPILTISR